MTEAFMAYPELRHPYDEKPVNPEGGATVLYAGRVIHLAHATDNERLLVPAEDLPRINGFELKPEGACYGETCIPLTGDHGVSISKDGQQWIDLEALADLIGQAYVADRDNGVWSFGEIPAKRQPMLEQAMAPELELTDRQGKVIRLSDFKGRKALIVTWSSW